MLRIHCKGTPREIGLEHGRKAHEAINRSIAFYTWMFQDSAKMSWDRVRELALEFEPVIRDKWPAYLEEMEGIATGSSLPLSDIIALNVRTEITFGLFCDGCTALSWHPPRTETAYLAQNWDWNERQKENLVQLTIRQSSKPTIKMITEAGIIGKIGLNSSGVGVCLNAIRAQGLDRGKLPVHLGLRMVLESRSLEEGVGKLEEYGVASACHMLIADSSSGMGLEWSAFAVQSIPMNDLGQIFHTNHYVLPRTKDEVRDTNWLADSRFRVRRVEELCARLEEPTYESLLGVFRDEKNLPGAICRRQEDGKTGSATLFNIVMDLGRKRARVLVGRPNEADEEVVLEFD